MVKKAKKAAKATNIEFKRITKGISQPDLVKIFNTPRDVEVSLSNIRGWQCVDPEKSHYRGMLPTTLELYKIKVGLVKPPYA